MWLLTSAPVCPASPGGPIDPVEPYKGERIQRIGTEIQYYTWKQEKTKCKKPDKDDTLYINHAPAWNVGLQWEMEKQGDK